MKKIITHFIKYPTAVNVVIVAIIFLGSMGMLSLKSSFFPLNESRMIKFGLEVGEILLVIERRNKQ